MRKVTTKYVVSDETGPLRSFYDPNEALRFAQQGWTITEIKELRVRPTAPAYEDLVKKYGEALF
jgi:hypothetical protein